ncbi:uncharacterized protein si:ch211-195m9.3 [Hippoglossus hippoglossus]|uniref:uncharacterized protein si:ch211-195m9.3 n=1 Tax=Hippoglossus hippoglossus TaxID=8267 RepID=UPI00148C67C5|nr:uncharacterized protein si:ch211-195m9.3 [Hippoglossus hippoglossus]
MAPPWIVGLVWLICSSITQCESVKEANAVPNKSCNRPSCMGKTYDIREAVCCEDQLHTEPGLSCCGKQPFNPALATCCQVTLGSTLSAKVTQDLSETVSACCGLEAYNPLNQMCCDSAIVAKPVPMAHCCGKRAYDKEKQMCCGAEPNRMVLTSTSNNHRCCSHKQFDTMTHCCCEMPDGLKIQPILSSCCVKESEILASVTKTAPKAQYCDKDAFDPDTHLCCGPDQKRKILPWKSSHHKCCGQEQYDSKTECCCETEVLQIKPINSICCAHELGVRPQTLIPQPKCTEPHTRVCGSSCYNPHELQCCEREHTTRHFNSGRCDATPTVYDPHTQVCCDGCLSKKEPWIRQCCGQTAYGFAERRVLCCNGTLYKDIEDGEECSDANIPFNPTKGTLCCSQFHGSPGQHCCGTETYLPQHEICCDGHRHRKGEHIHCCGIHAYNINDPRKCCAGTLHNLTSLGSYGKDAQCCGSILQKNQDVCCSGVDKEVHYSKKSGHRCCGHLYYDTSLWSCCAEKLSPLHQPGQAKMNDEFRYLSVNNLNSEDLRKEMNIGTVESVSLHSVVFRDVMKIDAVSCTAKALALPYILKTPDRCNKPKLIPGRTYFFDEVHVFPGSIHNPFQWLHLISSKCLTTF